MTTAAKKTPSALDFLQQALDDLNLARERATEEVREGIDRAVDGLRDTLKEMRSRATVQAEDLEDALARADENARRELGRVAVRAQRTDAALTELTREIRARKAELAAAE